MEGVNWWLVSLYVEIEIDPDVSDQQPTGKSSISK